MGDDSIKTTTITTPRQQLLLGDLEFTTTTKHPLGGINPFNEHYHKIGNQFLRVFKDHCGLNQASKILEIGCGTGRITNQLYNHIGQNGLYCGFDNNKRYLDYTSEKFKRTNFKFKYCDVQNDEYNKNGKVNPHDFVFPYDNNKFDIVIAVAVFNHLDTESVIRYLSEASRVLKPRGIFVSTILLLNDKSINIINDKTNPPYSFRHRLNHSWHDFQDRPLFNVAHSEQIIRRTCIQHDLSIKDPIRYGEWCLSNIALAGPDVLICKKGGWGQ